MITEDYCSYEVAKLLKEKGFNEPCDNYYNKKSSSKEQEPQELTWDEILYSYNKFIKAPTHQMAMKWLREVYKLSIEPYSIAIEENCIGYAYAICSCKTGLEIFAERWDGKNPFVSYEQAVEAALKYCLENLI